MSHTNTPEFYTPIHNIAIIGAKDKPGSPVDRVGRYLIHHGFTVYPVHPVRTNVWGLKTYSCLADIPDNIDLVNLFRAPEYCQAHAQEVTQLARRPLVFWMQQGIDSEEAQQTLAPLEITVIANKCLMVEHAAAFGHPLLQAGSHSIPSL